MRIVFLGTNGWYDTDTGNTLCVLAETKDAYLIFDAGTGIYKLDRYIKGSKPIYLFLSHFHLDHIGGLHILAKFNFAQGINIYGPKGVKKLFSRVINHPYSMPVRLLKTKIRLKEIRNNNDLPLRGEFKKLRHKGICYGYRFELDNKIVSFCTDTGICRNLLALAKNADLLISECAFRHGDNDDTWPHMNPEGAACAARKSGVKKLVLVHFDAFAYKTAAERLSAQRFARKVFANTVAAYDDLEIKL